MSEVEVGKIYRVKEESRAKCGNLRDENAKYVRIIDDYRRGRDCLAYDILNDNKERVDGCFDCLKPEDLEELESTKFKIGDRVKCIDESFGWGEVKVGDIGVVRDIQESGKIKVDFPNQDDWSADRKDLKPIDEGERDFMRHYMPLYPTAFTGTWIRSEIPPAESKIKKMLNKIPTTLKRILDADLQAQYKAGLIDGDLALTDAGKKEAWAVIQNMPEVKEGLTEVAKEIIKEAKNNA